MVTARSCVDPFIRRIQLVFHRTGSLRAAFEEIPRYQRVAKRIYRVDAYLIHSVAVSTPALAALLLYEYLRYRGLPFPNAMTITRSVMPAKNFSEYLVFGQRDDNERHAQMGKALQSEATKKRAEARSRSTEVAVTRRDGPLAIARNQLGAPCRAGKRRPSQRPTRQAVQRPCVLPVHRQAPPRARHGLHYSEAVNAWPRSAVHGLPER